MTNKIINKLTNPVNIRNAAMKTLIEKQKDLITQNFEDYKKDCFKDGK